MVLKELAYPEGLEPPLIQLRYYRLEVCSDTGSISIHYTLLVNNVNQFVTPRQSLHILLVEGDVAVVVLPDP